MVGQYIARKVINKMVAKVHSFDSEDDNMFVAVKSMLKKVEDKLPVIQSVIHAAEGKPIKSQVLTNWLNDVKDAAYEADDILDEIEFRELQEQVQESSKMEAFVSSALRFFKKLLVPDGELERLKKLVGNLDEILSLPPLGQLPFLKVLHITGMPALIRIGIEFYGDADPFFPSLEELKFAYLPQLEEWTEAVCMQFLPCLRDLKIYNCRDLRETPIAKLIPSLKQLCLWKCGDIDSDLHQCLQIQTSLVKLELRHYESSASVCLSNLSSLRHLELTSCRELRLDGGIRSLINLKKLNLFESPQLDQLGNLQIVASLSSLQTDESHLNQPQITLGSLPALSELQLEIDHWNVELEEWFQQLVSLEALKFSMNLLQLPTTLATMSIKTLVITNNTTIKSLPDDGLPISLKELHIINCPVLGEQCKKPDGADWRKIAHIPYIFIDNEEITQSASKN
ncbi:disease resistance protein RGA4 [Canna indica]|uniref:Disease resistance protein RGA4 n=1 Tax=Canna indica TaxID=4628 RepID=A0AAQ3KEI9_9LILI|nr:disease resistance protein RGA4 [Canna indica]